MDLLQLFVVFVWSAPLPFVVRVLLLLLSVGTRAGTTPPPPPVPLGSRIRRHRRTVPMPEPDTETGTKVELELPTLFIYFICSFLIAAVVGYIAYPICCCCYSYCCWCCTKEDDDDGKPRRTRRPPPEHYSNGNLHIHLSMIFPHALFFQTTNLNRLLSPPNLIGSHPQLPLPSHSSIILSVTSHPSILFPHVFFQTPNSSDRLLSPTTPVRSRPFQTTKLPFHSQPSRETPHLQTTSSTKLWIICAPNLRP